jgi:hypothetical protein
MKKKYALSMLLVTALVSVSPNNTIFSANAKTNIYMSVKLDELVDVKPKHWSYSAVKYVVEDLGVMEPKTSTRFIGDKFGTRYELSKTFYNAVKGLEKIYEKDLRLNEASLDNTLTDVNEVNKPIVNSVVNEYAIMQLMPDNKFMGNREMTRYELAFDLNNYLMLLEKKIGNPEVESRDRVSELKDISEQHWAYYSIKNIVDKYKIMDGYPQKVFGGDQKLTRYEIACIIRRFVEYVDKEILSIPQPTPTPEPTPTPTPIPTPVPTPTPVPKKPSTAFDVKAGASLLSLFNPSANNTFNRFDPAVGADVKYWFTPNFGLSLNGEYVLADDKLTLLTNASRVSGGAGLNWRVVGSESDEDISLSLGVGYGYNNWFGTTKAVAAHGPKVEADFEAPIAPWISLNLRDSFTLLALGSSGWRNDIFAGVTLPAYNNFGVQFGYKGIIYSVKDVSDLNTQHGLGADLRFRF